MGAAHHVLGLGYLEIDALTIRQILRYFDIDSAGMEVFSGEDGKAGATTTAQASKFVETFNRVNKFGVRE